MAHIITTLRRQKLCRRGSNASAALPIITHIAVGSGGATGNTPKAVTATQTALNTPLGSYAVSDVSYPNSTTARYTATIPAGDLSGQSISEAALVDSAGDLAAIFTFAPKVKDTGVALTFVFDEAF